MDFSPKLPDEFWSHLSSGYYSYKLPKKYERPEFSISILFVFKRAIYGHPRLSPEMRKKS
jgi:hypothetical protein